jgi:hypothetical protein
MNYANRIVSKGKDFFTVSLRFAFCLLLPLLGWWSIAGNVSSKAQARSAVGFSQLQSVEDQLLMDRYRPQTIVSLPGDTSSSSEASTRKLPNPKKVLYRSLLIPGWGQITNQQVWKVPIIYGLLGGLVGYSIYLNKKYHDYRAAYYNEVYSDKDGGSDFKFGPTPDYIPPGSNLSSLRYNRNYFRNQRDFMYIAIGLAYGLNAIDAYIFAHMRSFDVSDDLSASATVRPGFDGGPLGATISLGITAK